MKTIGATWAVCVAIAAASCAWPSSVEAATKKAEQSQAAKLVDETLRREATEGVDDRADLLKPAREPTPPYEAAYWHSGLIYDVKRKDWLSPDEVQKRAADDDRLVAYQTIRAKRTENEIGQAELARWCTKRKLEDQAQAHWTKVLGWAPDHLEARRQLGFQAVDGKWVNQQQVADAEAQFNNTQAALQQWAPKLETLLNRMEGSNQRASEQARQELVAIKDPAAVPAIMVVFCTKGGETAMFGIELLKNIRSPQSAAVLAWHAAFSPWPPIAQAAAKALQRQEKYDYVPLLLEAAQTPNGPQTQTVRSPNSQQRPPEVRTVYRLDNEISTGRWWAVEHLKVHPNWRQVPNMRYNPKSPDPVAKKTTKTVKQGGTTTTTNKREYYTVRNGRLQDRYTQGTFTTSRQRLTPVGAYVVPRGNSQTQPNPQQTEAERYRTEAARTTALNNIMTEATGVTGPVSPSQWWDWWYDYNEVYIPSGKPQNASNQTNMQTPPSDATAAQRGDCVAAGTLVRTETGPMAIEKIAVGDRVFCCDPETGCLALKAVLRKTARPAGSLLKIRVGGEDFDASGGHVFWVSGRGWVKARDLQEGMRLHTIRGTVSVESTEAGRSQPTFSLVVADFHTFFAGKGMILTHDNTIRRPTERVVPGLVGNGAAKYP